MEKHARRQLVKVVTVEIPPHRQVRQGVCDDGCSL